jgi:hypothetical protein
LLAYSVVAFQLSPSAAGRSKLSLAMRLCAPGGLTRIALAAQRRAAQSVCIDNNGARPFKIDRWSQRGGRNDELWSELS